MIGIFVKVECVAKYLDRDGPLTLLGFRRAADHALSMRGDRCEGGLKMTLFHGGNAGIVSHHESTAKQQDGE
jgi:hypothetical protein